MNVKTFRLIDTHAHLEEVEDLEETVERARNAGVAAIVAVGMSYQSNLKALEFSERYKEFVYPALGLHPWELGRMADSDIDAILKLVEENIHRLVGIGEIGLDYHKRVRALADKERQKAAFSRMLDIARRYDKPALVHSRYAWKDAFDAVAQSGVKNAVFHWYTGLSSVLRDIVAAGYFISATPAAEYHDEHRRAIREASLDNLLLETDTPVEYGMGTRYASRPQDVLRSLRAVSLIKGVDEAVIAERTTANAVRLFGLLREGIGKRE